MKNWKKRLIRFFLGNTFFIGIIVIVGCMGFIRAKNNPQVYTTYNEALTYIWNHMDKTERQPPSLDSTSYIWVSPKTERGHGAFQIVSFKNYVTQENLSIVNISDGKWEPKPTPQEEEVIKKIFENERKENINLIINPLSKYPQYVTIQ